MNEIFVKSISFTFDSAYFEIKTKNIAMFDCTIQPDLANSSLFDMGHFAIDSFFVIVLNDNLDFNVNDLKKTKKCSLCGLSI